jgi:hypothetical protein
VLSRQFNRNRARLMSDADILGRRLMLDHLQAPTVTTAAAKALSSMTIHEART